MAVLTSVVLVSTTLSTGAIGAPDDPPAATFDQTAGSRVQTIELDPDATPSDISVALSQATGQVLPVSEVLIARDNDFADALASGGLQDTRPLLLVPDNAGPLSDVAAEVQHLGAEHAVILGGTAAVGSAVVADLERFRTESGNTTSLDLDSLSENFLVSYITAMVRLDTDAELPAEWPGTVETNQPVRVASEFARVTCDGGIDELGNTWFSLPEGTDGTVTPTVEGGEVAMTRADQPIVAADEPLTLTADPALGPIGLYGTDDPATFPLD